MLEAVFPRSPLAAATLAALIGCGGGGGGGSTPTNPTSNPPAQSVNPCGAIAQGPSALTAITNGTDCSAENTPIMRLNMRDQHGGGLGSCSGTVITPRAVLTAAHCLDEGVNTVLVWRGVGEQIAASSFRGHPGYSGNDPAVDVGVVIVGEDLGRPAVPLLVSRSGQVGETAVVAGWGQDLQQRPAFLRAGTTTLSGVDSSVLRTLFSPTSSGICFGDSGGPILLAEQGTWSIAGIISATSGTTCNTGEHYYGAVRNQTIQSFIREHVPEATLR